MPIQLLALLAAVAGAPASAATLVVGNKGENTVSLVDLASGRARARLATGANPHEVAISPDGARAAVVAYGGNSIDIIDIARGARERTIDLGSNRRPHGLAWLADGRLVATTEGSDTLVVVSPDDRVAAIPTAAKGSHMVAVARDGSRAWVANMASGTVAAFDLAAMRKTGEVAAGLEPEGIALTPDARELWVADRRGDRVRVFDAATLRPLGMVAVGKRPIRVAISPDGRRAFTSNNGGGDLTEIDTATRRVTRTLEVSGSAEAAQVTILFARDGRHLYVAETGVDRVAEVDVASGRVLRRLPAGRNGDGLAISTVDVRPR